MSYSIQEAKMEFQEKIEKSIKERDGDTLYSLAQELASDGDVEAADNLFTIYKRWNQEDDAEWDYDRAVDNGIL